MPRIVWGGILHSEEEFPAGVLPENAVLLGGEADLRRMQARALPFLIPLAGLCLACMFVKTRLAGRMVVDLRFLFLGVLAGFPLLLAHELLHAVGFPRGATVLIGILPRALAPVALSASPVGRGRFVVLSLLPLALGALPLAGFCLGAPDARALNGLLFGLAMMGMNSVYPDLYNVWTILRTVPKGAMIQNHKNETWYVPPHP